MSPDRPIGDDDLQSFIDGRLPPERGAAVEAYLAAHPIAASAVASDIETRALLRARLASKAAESIPARLRVANILAERRRTAARRLRTIAATALWLVVGGGAGWYGKQYSEAAPMAMAGDAIAAYRTYSVETAHPVEVRADQKAHLVQWLSRRVGKPVTPPDLTTAGFRLEGGRVLPTRATPAAMLMYDDETGARLTLYAKADGQAIAGFRYERRDDVSTVSWTDRGLSYVVTARTGRQQLDTIAEAIDRQIRAGG